MSRPNYYQLLELDPDKHTTWPAIEPILKKKRNEWGMAHPTKKLEYQKNRSLIPDMEAVLKNPETCRAEADEYKKLQKTKLAESIVELDKSLKVTGAKGYLTEADVKILTAAGAGRWKVEDVRTRAKALGLKIEAAKSEVKRGPTLDGSKDKQISEALTLIGAPDLYALLSLPKSTTTKQLRSHADAEYQRIRTHGDKSKPEVNAKQELLGACLNVFLNDAERTKYDNTLASHKLKSIEKLAESAGAGEGKILAKVMDELIKTGKQSGLTQEEVVGCVTEVASRRKWAVEVPSTPSANALTHCATCGELSKHDKKCSQCGVALETACPKCKTLNRTGAQTCSSCRFEVGDMPLGERALRSARAALPDSEAVVKFVEEALRYWPGHPQALLLKEELDRQQNAVREKARQNQALHELVQKHCRQREFETARRELDKFERAAPGHADLPAFRAAIATAIKNAEAHVTRAATLFSQGKMDDALDAYEAALQVCADCHAAKEGRSRCPPLPPTALQLKASGSLAVLQWQASPSRGKVTYLVVRKADSQPTKPTDGVRVGETPALTLQDPKLTSGVRFYYAVFAVRSETPSHQAASAGPAVGSSEIEALVTQAGDGVVTLRWQPPPGVRTIEVWRKSNAEPVARNDGTRVACTLDSLVDSGLTNNTPYGYRIVAIFNGADLQPLATRGVTCLVTPVTPPQPVSDLKITLEATRYRATYTSPKQGLVQVFQLPEAAALGAGQAIPASEIPQLGKPLASVGSNAVGGPLGSLTELHLLPVSVIGSAYIAGKPVSQAWVPEVHGLKVQFRGNEAVVEWNWPPGVAAAVIVIRDDKFPASANERDALQVCRVTPEQYRAAGGKAAVAVSLAPKLYVSVFAAVNRTAGWQYAPGCSTSRCEVTPRVQRVARYSIKPKSSILNWLSPTEYVLQIQIDGLAELPELMVVSKPDGLPVRPSDGTVLVTTSPQTAHPQRITEIAGIAAPAWRLDMKNTSVFHAREEDGQWLELLRGR